MADYYKRATTPLAFAIPVISRSEPNSHSKGKQTFTANPKRRTYNDELLPTKLSNYAPRNARITGRIIGDSGVSYSLRVGDVELNDVGIEEVLDYVSPLELEDYEHRQFVEEREILAAVEAAREVRRQEKLERQKERAKRKGVVVFEEVTDTTEAESEEVEVGRHGRARPTYTHLFLKPDNRQRRRRHDSDSLDDSEGRIVSTTEDEPARNEDAPRSSDQPGELPKRRRRKRDKVTGELLPLSPIAEAKGPKDKRPRRKRHPVTGELMPLGWQYNPVTDGDNVDSHSFRKLSLAHEHQAKRQRLDVDSSKSRSVSPLREKLASPSASKHAQRQAEPISMLDSSSGQEGTTSLLRPSLGSPRRKVPQSLALSAQTSTAAQYVSSSDEAESSAADTDGGEWIVDAIVGHQYSDPNTHPAAFGSNPLMLYRTKWIGSDTLRWEPLVSFGDRRTVRDYRRGVGLPSEPSDDEMEQAEEGVTVVAVKPVAQSNIRGSVLPPSSEDQETDDDLEEDEFEIEHILAHHLSDPASHPPELGKTPIMLYEVKWKGWEETTWEPASSFEDSRILKDYYSRIGQRPPP